MAENARREVQCKEIRSDLAAALEAGCQIDALFEIERGISGATPERRRTAGQGLSTPLVTDFEIWMR